MEDFTFDIGSILSEEEAEKLFENEAQKAEETKPDEQEEINPAEEETQDDAKNPEKVGEEEKIEESAAPSGDGSSPTVYSSIASALKKDGIFPDFEDSELEAVKTAEDFAELFEKAIDSRVNADVKRVRDLINNGVAPDAVRNYEQTLGYLGSITEDALKAEGEEGDNLRKQLIYNDLLTRGYSQDKAMKELDKSLKAGTDVEDAKDALDALKQHYQGEYEKLQNSAREKSENAKKAQKQQAEEFRKAVLESELTFGDSAIGKRTRQKIYDAVSKPVYKDPESGQLLTAVQKFQKEQPLEFLKQLGMWYVLTDGGKNTSGIANRQAKAEKNKGIRELERKINASTLTPDGSLNYTSGLAEVGDPLSDGWKVGW